MAGGKPMELIVANHDMNKSDYNPVINTDHVNALSKGDTIKVTLDDSWPPVRPRHRQVRLAGRRRTRHIRLREHLPKTEGKLTYTAVVLSKLDEFKTLAVQLKKDKEGNSGPDAAVMDVVNTLKTGDVVEADVREARTPCWWPSRSTVRSADGKVPQGVGGGGRGAEGAGGGAGGGRQARHRRRAGELKNKRWVSDSKVLAAAKKFKPETEVVYRAREADGKVWLKEISARQQREEKERSTASAGMSRTRRPPDRSVRARPAPRLGVRRLPRHRPLGTVGRQ